MGDNENETNKGADVRDILRAIEGLESGTTERMAIINIADLMSNFRERLLSILHWQYNYPVQYNDH